MMAKLSLLFICFLSCISVNQNNIYVIDINGKWISSSFITGRGDPTQIEIQFLDDLQFIRTTTIYNGCPYPDQIQDTMPIICAEWVSMSQLDSGNYNIDSLSILFKTDSGQSDEYHTLQWLSDSIFVKNALFDSIWFILGN